MINSFIGEYGRYKAFGVKAIEQVPDHALNQAPGTDNNSIAMIVRHISGNFISRFTDFLNSDGEKPFRDRDAEFDSVEYTRQQVEEMWARGWEVVEGQLAALGDGDMEKLVYIRGKPLTVHEALSRSLAHLSYHVGQIVLLARSHNQANWKWITIPKGKSKDYNQNPTHEKMPG